MEMRVDLILWRHADAEDEGKSVRDKDRRLTPRGENHALQIADWLHAQKPRNLEVIAGPEVRTKQTARALQLPFKVDRKIGAGAHVVELLAAANWPDHSGAVLLVSHQPAIGRLASLLLAGVESEWTVKKGSLWWFTNRVRSGERQTIVRAVVNPA